MSTPTIKLLKSLEAKGAKICEDLVLTHGDLYLKDGTAARSMVKDVEFVEVISASDYPMLLDVAIEARATILMATAVIDRIDAIETFVEATLGAPAAGEDGLLNSRLEEAMEADQAGADTAFNFSHPIGGQTMVATVNIPTDSISMRTAVQEFMGIPGAAIPMALQAIYNLGLGYSSSTFNASQVRHRRDWQTGVASGPRSDGADGSIGLYDDRSYLMDEDGNNTFPDYAQRSVYISGIKPVAGAAAHEGIELAEAETYSLKLLKDQIVAVNERWKKHLEVAIGAINKLSGQSDTNIEDILAANYSPSADVVLTDSDPEKRHFDVSGFDNLPTLHSLAAWPDEFDLGLAELIDNPVGAPEVELPEIYVSATPRHGFPSMYVPPTANAFIVTSKLRVTNFANEVELRDIKGLDSLMGAADTSAVESIQDLLSQLTDLKLIADEALKQEQAARLEDVECLETSMSRWAEQFIESLDLYENALTEHISVSMQRMVEYAEGVIEDTVVDRWAQVHEADRAAAAFSYSDFVGATPSGTPSSVRVLINLDGYASHTQRSASPDQGREDISNWIIKTYIKSSGTVRNERIWSQASVTTMDDDGQDVKVLAVDIRTADCDSVYVNDQVTVLAVYTGDLDYGKDHDREFIPHELNCGEAIIPELKESFDSDSPCGDLIIDKMAEEALCDQLIVDWEVYHFSNAGLTFLRLTGDDITGSVMDKINDVHDQDGTVELTFAEAAPEFLVVTGEMVLASGDSPEGYIDINISDETDFFLGSDDEFEKGKAALKIPVIEADPEADGEGDEEGEGEGDQPSGQSFNWSDNGGMPLTNLAVVIDEDTGEKASLVHTVLFNESDSLTAIYLHGNDVYGDGFNGGAIQVTLFNDQGEEVAVDQWMLAIPDNASADGAAALFAGITLPSAGSIEVTVNPTGDWSEEISAALSSTPFPYDAMETYVPPVDYASLPEGMMDSGLDDFDPDTLQQDAMALMEAEYDVRQAGQRLFTVAFGYTQQALDAEGSVILDEDGYSTWVFTEGELDYADEFTVIVDDNVEVGRTPQQVSGSFMGMESDCGFDVVGLSGEDRVTYTPKEGYSGILRHSVTLTVDTPVRIRYGKSTGWGNAWAEFQLPMETSPGEVSYVPSDLAHAQLTDYSNYNGDGSSLEDTIQGCPSEPASFNMDEITVVLREVGGVHFVYRVEGDGTETSIGQYIDLE